MTEQTKAKPAASTAEEKTVTCRVLRDYWPSDAEEDRVRKGAVIEVPVSVALDGVESGSLQRMKG